MTSSPAVTKQDLDDLYLRFGKDLNKFFVRIEKMVGDVVGEIVGDALQLISEKFEEVDKRFDAIDKRFDRLELKLDTAADIVDHHTVDIRAIQRKIA